jgi:transcriptional regulator with XRE-family HTH domain
MFMKSTYFMEYDNFKNALKKARIEQGLTQKVVAERLGVPQSFVSKYENGERRLDVVEFMTIAQALGIRKSGSHELSVRS